MDGSNILFMMVYFIIWAILFYGLNISLLFNKKTDGKFSLHPYYTLASQLEGFDIEEFQSIYDKTNLRTNIFFGISLNFIYLGLSTRVLLMLIGVGETRFDFLFIGVLYMLIPIVVYAAYLEIKYGADKPHIITWKIFLNKRGSKSSVLSFKRKINPILKTYFKARDYVSQTYPNKPHYIYDLLAIPPETYITSLQKDQERIAFRLLINDTGKKLTKSKLSIIKEFCIILGLSSAIYMTLLLIVMAQIEQSLLDRSLLPLIIVGLYLIIYFFRKITEQKHWTKLDVILSLSNHGIQSNEDTVIEDLLQFSIKEFNKLKLEYIA